MIRLLFGFLFSLLIVSAVLNPAQAQSCNPAVVSYLVRDEKGELMSAENLKTLAAGFLEEKVGNSLVYVDEVSFAEDGVTFYWPESVEWQKGKKSPSLTFANAETCTMNLTQIVLVHNKKKMRLVFNVDIARAQKDRRPVIDSIALPGRNLRIEPRRLVAGGEQNYPGNEMEEGGLIFRCRHANGPPKDSPNAFSSTVTQTYQKATSPGIETET